MSKLITLIALHQENEQLLCEILQEIVNIVDHEFELVESSIYNSMNTRYLVINTRHKDIGNVIFFKEKVEEFLHEAVPNLSDYIQEVLITAFSS